MLTIKIHRVDQSDYCVVFQCEKIISFKTIHNDKKYSFSKFNGDRMHPSKEIIWVKIFYKDDSIDTAAIWKTCGTEIDVYENGSLIHTIKW